MGSSLVRSEAAWNARDTKIDPMSGTLFNEDLVMAILQIPLIQGEHLSFNDEKNVHKVLVTCLREFAQGLCGYDN